MVAHLAQSSSFRILRAIALSFLGPLSVFAPSGAAQGIITTVAGGGEVRNGPAISALLPQPVDVTKDGLGNLFILSVETADVYKVDSSGQLTVAVGNDLQSGGAIGVQATSASLNFPLGIAIDRVGNLFIADNEADKRCMGARRPTMSSRWLLQ